VTFDRQVLQPSPYEVLELASFGSQDDGEETKTQLDRVNNSRENGLRSRKKNSRRDRRRIDTAKA
jgi:hypothetical protein